MTQYLAKRFHPDAYLRISRADGCVEAGENRGRSNTAPTHPRLMVDALASIEIRVLLNELEMNVGVCDCVWNGLQPMCHPVRSARVTEENNIVVKVIYLGTSVLSNALTHISCVDEWADSC
jgi:hypothetical protein